VTSPRPGTARSSARRDHHLGRHPHRRGRADRRAAGGRGRGAGPQHRPVLLRHLPGSRVHRPRDGRQRERPVREEPGWRPGDRPAGRDLARRDRPGGGGHRDQPDVVGGTGVRGCISTSPAAACSPTVSIPPPSSPQRCDISGTRRPRSDARTSRSPATTPGSAICRRCCATTTTGGRFPTCSCTSTPARHATRLPSTSCRASATTPRCIGGGSSARWRSCTSTAPIRRRSPTRRRCSSPTTQAPRCCIRRGRRRDGRPRGRSRAYRRRTLVPPPRNAAALGLAYDPTMGSGAAALSAPRALYRGLRPVALRELIAMAAQIRTLSDGAAPLHVAPWRLRRRRAAATSGGRALSDRRRRRRAARRHRV
jgi:hypothetical protein